MDQNNSEYGHFLRSVNSNISLDLLFQTKGENYVKNFKNKFDLIQPSPFQLLLLLFTRTQI